MSRRSETEKLSKHLVESIDRGQQGDVPFFHLRFDHFFPDDVYAAMLREMPETGDYRALKGRGGGNILDDGTATRVKIDLFPEYVRVLPSAKRELWDIVRPRALLE